MAALEQADYRFIPELGGMPVLSARFTHQNFSKHSHEGYCIGVIDKGAQRFYRSGGNHIASEDCIILVNPDQLHDGHAATEGGWQYRAIYPLGSTLAHLLPEFNRREQDIPLFSEPVVSDYPLACHLRQLLHSLQHSDNSLQRESLFLTAMSQLMQKHAKGCNNIKHLGREPKAILQLCDYIQSHFADNISLDHLATLAGFNKFYLIRSFKKHLGIAPHAYQIQVRTRKARLLLQQGMSASNVAQATGFNDQSHLNRHFIRTFGTTPGRFQKAFMTNGVLP